MFTFYLNHSFNFLENSYRLKINLEFNLKEINNIISEYFFIKKLKKKINYLVFITITNILSKKILCFSFIKTTNSLSF